MPSLHVGQSAHLAANLEVIVMVGNVPNRVWVHAGDLCRILASVGTGWRIITEHGIETVVAGHHLRPQASEYLLPEMAPTKTLSLF